MSCRQYGIAKIKYFSKTNNLYSLFILPIYTAGIYTVSLTNRAPSPSTP